MDDAGKQATGQLGQYGTMRAGDRPFSEIVNDIVGHAQEIVRSEIRLAKAEVREEASEALQAGILLGVGAFVALFGVGFLLWCATYALGLVVPMWAATLIVGAVLAIAGGIALSMGLARFRHVQPVPDKTIREVKEDARWLKQQTKS